MAADTAASTSASGSGVPAATGTPAAGGNPAVYALVVAVSTSNVFLIPSANPVIMIIAGPGGYRNRDFLRVGVPLTLLMLVVMLLAVNVVFGRS